ncbi:MAG: methyltransferase type 11 [Acidimicrobiales bacterium]|nr:methyltransferase type 11 [Acidimicrobiales bacterium]
MIDSSEVLHFMERAAARTRGEDDADDAPDDAYLATRSEGVLWARDRLHDALQHVHAGGEVPKEARLRPIKKAIVTAMRPVTSHQADFNRSALGAIDGVVAEAERLAVDMARQEQASIRLQAAVATTDLTVDDINDTVRRFGDEVERMAGTVAELRAAMDAQQVRISQTIDRLRSDLETVRARQDLIFRAAREALPGGYDVATLSQLTRELSTGYEQLYEDLEDTFRGSRDHVKALVADYLDDLAKVPGRGPVVDIGCGRGEWLEVLRDADVPAYGVDVNQVVVDRCTERGLDVRNADALTHLREVPEGSVRAVTSIHVVEHLSLDTLVGLIDAALVALQPGGLLVFETPNPTNLGVGAASFYLDPTHLKPLHPQFLEFLLLARGFAQAEVRFLHAEEGKPRLQADDLGGSERAQGVADHINWALFGPLDVAVLARKAAPADEPASPA